MSLQIINESFVNFIEEKQLEVPEDFIQIFIQSITMDQWIDSETAKRYLEYARSEHLGRSLQTFFKENIDYREISKEEYQQLLSRFENVVKNGEQNRPTSMCGKKQKDNRGGHLKKYYLISPETFKTMLLLRKNENGDRYRRYMITLEKIFKEFMIEFCGSKENLIQRLQKIKTQLKNKLINTQQELMDITQEFQEQLDERDEQIVQQQDQIIELSNRVNSEVFRYRVIKIYKINEEDQQYEIDHPQIICYTTNLKQTMDNYSRLLNKYYKQTYTYGHMTLSENVSKVQAVIDKINYIEQLTGEQRQQHSNIQRIIPLFP